MARLEDLGVARLAAHGPVEELGRFVEIRGRLGEREGVVVTPDVGVGEGDGRDHLGLGLVRLSHLGIELGPLVPGKVVRERGRVELARDARRLDLLEFGDNGRLVRDVGRLVLLAEGLEVDHPVALGLLDLLSAPDRAVEDAGEDREEVGLVLRDLGGHDLIVARVLGRNHGVELGSRGAAHGDDAIAEGVVRDGHHRRARARLVERVVLGRQNLAGNEGHGLWGINVNLAVAGGGVELEEERKGAVTLEGLVEAREDAVDRRVVLGLPCDGLLVQGQRD